MLKKQDHAFFDMLADAEKLEKRLIELASQRFMFAISATMSALVFFFTLFVLLAANLRSVGLAHPPSISIATPVSGCLTMIALLAITLARAVGAHSEIRTLITFKKLRDMPTNA